MQSYFAQLKIVKVSTYVSAVGVDKTFDKIIKGEVVLGHWNLNVKEVVIGLYNNYGNKAMSSLFLV